MSLAFILLSLCHHLLLFCFHLLSFCCFFSVFFLLLLFYEMDPDCFYAPKSPIFVSNRIGFDPLLEIWKILMKDDLPNAN